MALKLQQHLFTEHTTVDKNHCELHKKVLLVKHRDEKIKIDFQDNKFQTKQTKAGKKDLQSHLVLKKNHFWFWFQKVETGLLVQHVNDPCRAAELNSSISC